VPRLTFFIGKGGVGKTTLSSSYAVRLAAKSPRSRVLLLSTDPAHSLAGIFETRLTASPKQIGVGKGKLSLWQLDAERVFRKFLDTKRESILKLIESGTLFSADEIAPLLDTSLPGMAEAGALLALKDLVQSDKWDEVVIDTAPIGHTLRLFALPEHFDRFLRFLDLAGNRDRWLTQRFGKSRHTPTEEIMEELREASDAMHRVLSGDDSRVYLVTSPERFSLKQSVRSMKALRELTDELPLDGIIINRAVRTAGKCARCKERAKRSIAAADFLQKAFPKTEQLLSEDPGHPIIGAQALLEHANTVFGAKRYKLKASKPAASLKVKSQAWPQFSQPLSFTLGKGGVGKTTVSAAIAYLARERSEAAVTICSTDPAPSLDEVFEQQVIGTPRPVLGDKQLRAIEVDSVAEFRVWADAMQEKIAGAFSQQRSGIQVDVSFDRQIFSALLDIVPPGVDEIFAIFKILDLTSEGSQRVVIDMAPTGHALELLRMPERIAQWTRLLLKTLATHRTLALAQDVAVEIATIGQRVRTLHAIMQDPKRSCAIAVMLPEPLPEAQTEYLLKQLEALGIAASAVFVNRVLLDDVSCGRCFNSQTWQRNVLQRLARKPRRGARVPVYLLPEQAHEVAGKKALGAFTSRLYRME
jgi:arsenite-transporting ATPase